MALVHIVDGAAQAGHDQDDPKDQQDGPVMLVALQGFLDAGNAAALAVRHLLATDQGRVVASFAVDELYDYRARRPPLTFHEDHYTDYDPPRLNVRRMSDSGGASFLLLAGPEPDVRWEAFAKAVRRVVDAFGVSLVVALGSVPMAAPHTRPVQLTNHATDARLLVQENVWRGQIRVPSSAQALLEVRLGEWGHDAMGFVAHVPHYVAGVDYPAAAVALLGAVADVTGLTWDVEELRGAAEAKQVEIAWSLRDSPEVAEEVKGLEQQYDAFHQGGRNLLAHGEALPSGEELGAQFEQFLSRLDDEDD